MADKLEAANQKQNELLNEINNSKSILEQRPLFHFSTPAGWCNNPNGAMFWQCLQN